MCEAYNDPEADIILCSNDDMLFRVHLRTKSLEVSVPFPMTALVIVVNF